MSATPTPTTPPAHLSGGPLNILLQHDHWATGQLLAACAPLTPAQFHQRFEMGLGSLHNNIVHTIGAKLRWADRIAQRNIAASIEGAWPTHIFTDAAANPPTLGANGKPEYTLAQLSSLELTAHQAITAVAADAARGGTLGKVLPIPLADGRTYYLSPAGALAHVATHGVHHRAQSINMLRQIYKPLGKDAPKLPMSSVMEWQTIGEPMV